MKLSNHQKHKIKASVFKKMTGMLAPSKKMVIEDEAQYSRQIMEWYWFNIEYEILFKHIHTSIEDIL